MNFNEVQEEAEGILLYYKYIKLNDYQEEVLKFYKENGLKLSLRGRVRVALDGINATLGGSISNLKSHIQAITQNTILNGSDIDFKLSTSSGSKNSICQSETGFTSLNVNCVKELVSLGCNAYGKADQYINTATYMNPQQFHQSLLDIQENKEEIENTILLDVRNLYESRIGYFNVDGVLSLKPSLRAFSDLPIWIDTHLDHLKGKNIMMYCTGGVRCEKASAYIKEKGEGFENVKQLQGGIQRYIEAFSDEGFFKGKNFVFDERVSVSNTRSSIDTISNITPDSNNIVGKCLICDNSWDDYSTRIRCQKCRMLVLICPTCSHSTQNIICEICKEKQTNARIRVKNKLKILCLHGFRQTSKSFFGRTCALRKKLSEIAEFEFIDGPHELPFIISNNRQIKDEKSNIIFEPSRPRKAWLIASNELNEEEKLIEQQWKNQCEGWQESYNIIKSYIESNGPFDGILGFSQGACIASAICAIQELKLVDFNIKFAIFASGYLPESEEILNLLNQVKMINLPSLHIFGEKDDKQILKEDSLCLADYFDVKKRVIIEHDKGHIIPCTKGYVFQYIRFLEKFCELEEI